MLTLPVADPRTSADAVAALPAGAHAVLVPFGAGSDAELRALVPDAEPTQPTRNQARTAGVAAAVAAEASRVWLLDELTRLAPDAVSRVAAVEGDLLRVRAGAGELDPGSWVVGTALAAAEPVDAAHEDCGDAAVAGWLQRAGAAGEVIGPVGERVRPRGSAFGAAEDWTSRLPSWCAMVAATVPLLTDAHRLAWVRERAEQLPQLLTAVERGGDQGALVAAAGLLLDAIEDPLALPVETRVVTWLVAWGRVEDAAGLLAERHREEGQFPTRRVGAQIVADLGLDLPEEVLPQRLLEVSPQESPLRASLRRVRWLGERLEVDLFAGISHLHHEQPEVTVEWVRVPAPGTAEEPQRVPARTTRLADPYPNRFAGFRYADHRPAAVTASVPLLDLAHGTWRLRLSVREGEVVREGVVAHRDLHGSAGAPRPSPNGSARPRWSATHGLELLVDRPGTHPSSGPEGPEVLTAFLHGADLVLAVVGSWGEAALHGPGEVVLPAVVDREGDRMVARFSLRHDRWGLGETAAPAGRYRLRVDSQPVRWDVETADLLGFDLVTDPHRIGLRRARDGQVLVTLAAPLADDEYGPYDQARLAAQARAEPLLEQVFLQSYTGQSCTDSPRAVDAELARTRPDLPRLWLVQDHATRVPAGARPVVRLSREWHQALARSSWIVTNIEMEGVFDRREGQRVLQTFHGYPSKSMGIGLWRSKNVSERRITRQLSRTSAQWSALVTPSEFCNRFYREQYDYTGPILDVGYPRDDALVPPDSEQATATRDRVRGLLGIAESQRAVLYAPTWRDDLAINHRSAKLGDALDLEALATRLGPDYVLLLRGHRFHARAGMDTARASAIVDVTDYPEINDLILASDAAVVDYSSLRFDFALTGRPMVFHVPDLEQYAGPTRGFLFPFEETTPGPLTRSTDEVAAALADLPSLQARYAEDLAAFNARFNDRHDGHAAQRVVAEFFGSADTMPG